jgi:DNA-binding NarL/FixJ family response regulator
MPRPVPKRLYANDEAVDRRMSTAELARGGESGSLRFVEEPPMTSPPETVTGMAPARPTATPAPPPLPPRLREALACLLEGDSEKQVARRLGLSRHTVHDYAKDLYRRLGVGSRAELMALCLRRQDEGAPDLLNERGAPGQVQEMTRLDPRPDGRGGRR